MKSGGRRRRRGRGQRNGERERERRTEEERARNESRVEEISVAAGVYIMQSMCSPVDLWSAISLPTSTAFRCTGACSLPFSVFYSPTSSFLHVRLLAVFTPTSRGKTTTRRSKGAALHLRATVRFRRRLIGMLIRANAYG